MRAAAKVADEFQIPALVTGECVGQVSSQTLTNLNVIDRVTDKVILRPAHHLGQAGHHQRSPPHRYPGVRGDHAGVLRRDFQKPTVKAELSRIEAEEENFDFAILDKVVAEAVTSTFVASVKRPPPRCRRWNHRRAVTTR